MKDCVSLEIAKKLKEAGWEQNKDVQFYWYPEHWNRLSNGDGDHVPDMLVDRHYRNGTSPNSDFLAAPTIGELLEALPNDASLYKSSFGKYSASDTRNKYPRTNSDTCVNPADALALLWMALKEKGIL